MHIVRREGVIVTVQLDETNKAIEIFENELTFKETKIESMEKWNIEETRGIADEAQNKILRELLRTDVLGKEMAKYRMKQAELEEKVKEKELLLKSSQDTFDAELNVLAINCQNGVAKYKEEIMKIST